ncbi:MAG: bifunctional serine/threonine-protein kinase/formylglycine-generating enzyme family protein [Thermodesulfobacteriota bacterium]
MGKELKREPLLSPGDVLGGRWEILQHIATGGKGEVYRARQIKLDREVAVKIVSPELIEAFEGDQEEIQGEMQRFRREVLAMAQARHANVLQVYDFETAKLAKAGQELNLDFIVMEYIPGPTLASTIPEQGMGLDQTALQDWIARYFLPVLDGVEHIHGLGIIHRDLKPANVLLDNGVPKITDFGLVGGRRWQPVTRSHHVIGTLAYMAPEQFLDLAATDQRADVYSLGKILYNAVVGKLGKDTMRPLQTASLPHPDTPLLKALDRVIQRATAEDPDKRLASVPALRQALAQAAPAIVPSAPAPARRRAWLLSSGLALLLAAALAAGVWYHYSERPAPAPAPPAATPRPGPPAAEIKARDGSTLRLIPAGQAKLPGPKGSPGRTQAVPAFYMDETEVTNHQYVEFLNQVKDRLQVREGVVWSQDKAWLHLGEVKVGYEPIAFRQGRFQINAPALAANPVVKVTAHGAAAYAAHFGKRLPSEAEWLRAAQAGAPSPPAPTAGGAASAEMHDMHTQAVSSPAKEQTGYLPVSHFPPNALGIRGLAANVGEWVLRRGTAPLQYVIMEPGRTGQPAPPRQPWEALPRVGFRAAQDAPAPAK